MAVIENIVVKIFWDEILTNELLKIFRPDQLLQKIIHFLIILGVIGLFNYIVGFFTEASRNNRIRHYLAIIFITGLVIESLFRVV